MSIFLVFISMNFWHLDCLKIPFYFKICSTDEPNWIQVESEREKINGINGNVSDMHPTYWVTQRM